MTRTAEGKAIRLWRELSTLRAGGMLTTERIAREFGVDRRTAQRDMEDLQEMGPPVVVLSLNPLQVRCAAVEFDAWLEVQR